MPRNNTDGSLSGEVHGQQGVAIRALGNVSKPVVSAAGDVLILADGDISGHVSAPAGKLHLAALGTISGNLSAGREIRGITFGSLSGNGGLGR
jgi:hypothetical protein